MEDLFDEDLEFLSGFVSEGEFWEFLVFFLLGVEVEEQGVAE